YRMPSRYAERRGFKVEQLGVSPSDGGGYKEVTFAVKGDGAYRVFKWEGGTHRVQRVPETESQGRIHTTTATVAVMPEAEEVEVSIDPNLQLSGEPAHRPPDQVDGASARPDPPGRARRLHRGAQLRRPAPRTLRLTLREALDVAERRLASAGIDTPRVDAELLLAHVTG